LWQFKLNHPSDANVVEFLTDVFLDLYLKQSIFHEGDITWGKTISGQDSGKQEKNLNKHLIDKPVA